jgi:hypothetical protein
LNKESYNNVTTNVSLFLNGLGTNVIVETKDDGLSPVEGYYTKIYRYYPEDNSYEIVEHQLTDEYGQFVAQLIENDVKYQFEFLDENNTVKKRTDDMTIACRTSICVLPFIIEDTTDDFERFNNLTDYDWSFSFTNSSKTFTFTWTDVSGVSATSRLQVTRYLWNGTEVLCNTTSTSSSETLNCVVGDIQASYQAQAFRKIGTGAWRRIGFLSETVGDTFEKYGKEGLLWSFFLLMTMIAIGYWKPPIGIALYLGGIIALSYLKIISLNPAIIVAQIVIGVAFMWAFRG